MSFLHTNDLQLTQNGEFVLNYGFEVNGGKWIMGLFTQTVEVNGYQTENKMKQNKKKNFLKRWASGFEVLR